MIHLTKTTSNSALHGIVLTALLVACVLSYGNPVSAQKQDPAWAPPVNVSSTGAATQPAITMAPDGIAHVVWWDQIDGEQYARTTNITSSAWLKTTTLDQIFGRRTEDTATRKVTLTPPRGVQLRTDGSGALHVFWFNDENQLQTSRLVDSKLTEPTLIAGSGSALDVNTDISGTIHLVYARSLSSAEVPSGLYYRFLNGVDWSDPILIFASPYFRTATSSQLHLSVATAPNGHLLVAWEDTRLGYSYSSSLDNGATWSAPRQLPFARSGNVSQPVVGATSDGIFIMIWRDLSKAGCGYTQSVSNDGGATWQAPELILPTLTRCSDTLQLHANVDGRLWLVGLPEAIDRQATDKVVDPAQMSGNMAVWDGKSWSSPVTLQLTPGNTDTQPSRSLNCLQAAIETASMALLGCDSSGDVWVSVAAKPPSQLVTQAKLVWNQFLRLSQDNSSAGSSGVVAPEGLPVVVADAQDHAFTLWSESTAPDMPGTAIYASVLANGQWTLGNQVLQSPDTAGSDSTNNPIAIKAEQPAATISQGKLHVVWSGGSAGGIFYSSALLRDASTSQGWSTPIALPSPSAINQWPSIASDPRGNRLYVVYSVPYNEKRGIWFTRSDDSGATWSQPVLVFDAIAAGLEAVNKPRLAFDPAANTLHTVWLRSTVPGELSTQAIYYDHSSDGGQTWTKAEMLSQGIIDWPQITIPQSGQAYILWLQRHSQVKPGEFAPYDVVGRISLDEGQHWGNADNVFGLERVSGPVGISSDYAGTIHTVGVGATQNAIAALLYTRWDGQGWIAAEKTALNQVARENNAVAVAPSGQSTLLASLRLWTSSVDGINRFAVGVTGRAIVVGAPIKPFATFTPEPTPSPMPTATPQPTATPEPRVSVRNAPPGQTGALLGPQQPLILGIILAVFLLAGMFVIVSGIVKRSSL